MPTKTATTSYPILPVLAERWSPYNFSDRSVSDTDLQSLFEAARWAASSYNEQPWSYLLATKEDPPEFARLLSCLTEANQVWAKTVPVLILTVVSQRFARNNEPNRAAIHDLGLASANLVLEATSRHLSAHQMVGILPDRAREIYRIPEHFEAWTGIAIGYAADPARLPEATQVRDRATRQRKPWSQFVFTGTWGRPATLGPRPTPAAGHVPIHP